MEQVNGQMDEQQDGCMYSWMDEYMHGWIDQRMHAWIYEWCVRLGTCSSFASLPPVKNSVLNPYGSSKQGAHLPWAGCGVAGHRGPRPGCQSQTE